MNTCPNEDLKKLHKKMNLKKDKFKYPKGNELKRLNKICSRCRRALKIYEEKCPVCETNNISKPTFDIECAVSIDVSFYKCSICDRNLYSNKSFY
jgi:RNA polymerase subunit RPABC4/transcription elongation factor Spt4